MKCRRCQQLLSEHSDGDLSPRRAREVDQHLAGCAECAAVAIELAEVTGLLGGLVPAEPGDGLWGRIDAALDSDQRERRRPRWPVLVPAIGGAALLATVGVANGLHAGARRNAQAVDVAMRQAAGQAVRQVELRYLAAESEALRLAADPAALPASSPWRSEGTPAAAMTIATADEVERGFDRIEARLAARGQQVLEVAEAWAGGGVRTGDEVPALRDPWAEAAPRARSR